MMNAAMKRFAARLARNYDLGMNQPNIQVVDVDLLGNRQLRLQHTVREGIVLSERRATRRCGMSVVFGAMM